MAAVLSNLEKYAHEYQESHSPEALDEIVALVDGLVLSVVHQMLRAYQGVVDVEFEDLHQMGMIGVIHALTTLPDDFDENQIRMRVVAYVKAILRSQFSISRRQLACKCCIMNRGESVSDKVEHLKMEVRELFNLLIEENVLTRRDFYFLYHKIVDEFSVRELADMYGISSGGVINWERRLLNTLRNDERVRGFACVD